MHKDVSIENIFVMRRGKEVFGVLGDWDLAGVPMPRGRPERQRERAGTNPYKSADFYATWWTGEHLYRHDLESFYYVLAVFCAGFDPKTHTVRVPEDWLAEAKRHKADRRRHLSKYHDTLFQYAAPEYRELADKWVVALHKLFTRTIITTYDHLTSVHAIFIEHASASKEHGSTPEAGVPGPSAKAVADDTACFILKYLNDREKGITYRRFLECIDIDDEACHGCSTTSHIHSDPLDEWGGIKVDGINDSDYDGI